MARKKNVITYRDEVRTLMQDQEFVNYPPNSTFRIWFGDVPDYFGTHWHSAVEILMPIEGCCTVNHVKTQYKVKAGEILVTPSGEMHDMKTDPHTKRYIFLFEMESLLSIRDFAVIKPMMMFPVYIPAESPACSAARDLLMNVIREYSSELPLRELNCYAYILMLYALMGRGELTPDNTQVNLQSVSQLAHLPVFHHVLYYIDHHYMEDLSLGSVAAEAGFSKYHFSRLFKQHTTVTFWHFLSVKRVQKAEQLLASTSLGIAEIALQAGFDSIPSFNRIYRKIRSCTPSQYRAKCRSNLVS